MFSLKGKTAVVTGGGSGIGKAVAELFAEREAVVHVIELNAEAAEKTIQEIKAKKQQGFAWACNVADQLQVKQTVEKIAASGKIDILINSAGIAHIGKIENTSEADFDRIFSVNVKGVYNMMQAVVANMKTNGGGVILNVASVASECRHPGPVRLLHEQGCCAHDDAFGGERLHQRQHSLQLYFSGSCAHCVRRWFSESELSWKRRRDV